MIVRPMAQKDLGYVAEIEQAYPSPWDSSMIADELAFAGSIALVGLDDAGVLVGWCCTRHALGEAELLKIAIRPDRKRAGIGALLFLHLEKILLRHSVETLFLEVRSLNKSALCFYRKHGFQDIGVRPKYYTNPEDNALIFKKTLL